MVRFVRLSELEVPVSYSSTPSPLPSSKRSGAEGVAGAVKSIVTSKSELIDEILPAGSTTLYENV